MIETRKLIIIGFLIMFFSPVALMSHGSNQHSTSMNNDGVSEDSNPKVKKELELVRIDEKVGSVLNTDLEFKNQNGELVKLDDFFGEKPVVLSFVYYSCPLFCQYVLQAKEKVLKEVGLELGSDYDALTISFDYKDTEELAKATYDKFAANFGDKKVNWNFLYGNRKEIMNITSQVGFHFEWVEENQEYAHTAAIYVITPDKKISRYFYGINYSPFDLKLAILESKEEKFKSTTDRILLYCYRYSSETRGYALHARNVMKAGGLLTIVIVFGFIFLMLRREKNKNLVRKD